MQVSKIICAGLNCLDLQLIGCTRSSEEAIERYDTAVYCAGGSALQTAVTLSAIVDDSLQKIQVLTKIGDDRNGEILMDFTTGVDTTLTIIDPTAATAMSVLPIFKDGKRGCFFNLASNDSFTKDEIISRLSESMKKEKEEDDDTVDAFLFGYPHLMPQLQGGNLKSLLESTKKILGKDTLIGVDLNGVSPENHNEDILGPALPYIDILHLNEEEAEIILSEKQHQESYTNNSNDDDSKMHKVADQLHRGGCAVVLLSLGSRGSFISVTSDEDRLAECPAASHWKAGSSVRLPAFAISPGGKINTNGAGDALFAGFCLAAKKGNDLTLEQAGKFASLVARQRCDSTTRDNPPHDANALFDMVLSEGKLPPIC